MAVVEESSVIAGVVHVVPELHHDERGSFAETYRRSWFPGRPEMVQGNRADRRAGTVVGLHYHRHQSDYWYVVSGRARAVLHDLRVDSPTRGATVALDLGGPDGIASEHQGLYIPPGVGHGFAARTDVVLTYLVDRTYDPDDELGIAWDDPDVAADWTIDEPSLSVRDQGHPRLADLAPELLPGR